MPRFFVDLSFDGTNYCGWQRQNNALSVQQILEEKFSLKLAEKVKFIGCGRTDAGVHARQFVAHADINNLKDIPDFIYRINRFLPEDIVINQIYEVLPTANARFSAIKRTYKYYISRKKNPFIRNYSYEYISFLDKEIMNSASDYLLNNVDDFTSFTKLHGGSNNARCVLYECFWEEKDDLLVFTITANRFTRNMVRAIVGTMIDLGRGKISFDDFVDITKKKNRCIAGESVEAKGLFLEKVEYPDNIKI
jgi:tRNA pseudouridine38-40 synthase